MQSARRVIFRRYGPASVLEIERVPIPQPAAGEVLVDVAFAGINYADVLARRGFYKWASAPPTCVGFEVSGTVRALGAGVSSLAVGDRVFGVTRFGGYADAIVLEARRLWPVPEGMSLEEAAAFPAVYLTAWHALHEVARVRAGESVLIQAVAGGVGIAALQLCRHWGLVTFGTASRSEKLAVAREHGLDHAINYAEEDFEQSVMRITGGRGVDVVLDSLGGEGLRKGYRCLARGGCVVTIGAAQVAPTGRTLKGFLGAAVELVRGGLFHPFQLIEQNRGIAGVQILLWWDDVDHLDKGMTALLDLYRAGAVRPLVHRVVPLEEAREAHEHLGSRASVGKLLLRCGTGS